MVEKRNFTRSFSKDWSFYCENFKAITVIEPKAKNVHFSGFVSLFFKTFLIFNIFKLSYSVQQSHLLKEKAII